MRALAQGLLGRWLEVLPPTMLNQNNQDPTSLAPAPTEQRRPGRFEVCDPVTEACELASKLAEVLEHARSRSVDPAKVESLRLAEGLARSVIDTMTDLMSARRARIA